MKKIANLTQTTTMKEKLLSAWIFVKPSVIKFGKFVWTNKTYSMVSVLIGVIIGAIFL